MTAVLTEPAVLVPANWPPRPAELWEDRNGRLLIAREYVNDHTAERYMTLTPVDAFGGPTGDVVERAWIVNRDHGPLVLRSWREPLHRPASHTNRDDAVALHALAHATRLGAVKHYVDRIEINLCSVKPAIAANIIKRLLAGMPEAERSTFTGFLTDARYRTWVGRLLTMNVEILAPAEVAR